MILCFDTETTGLPSAKQPLDHPSQPHLVSCSALQVTPEWCIRQSMSKLVASSGWSWDDSAESIDRAFQVHKLSVEICRSGRSEKEVLDELLHLWYPGNEPAMLVAHNLSFDKRIIEIAIARYYPGEENLLVAWQSSPGFCTMQEMRRIKKELGLQCGVDLKSTHQHLLGEDFDNAHSANADAVAVYRIFSAMQQED